MQWNIHTEKKPQIRCKIWMILDFTTQKLNTAKPGSSKIRTCNNDRKKYKLDKIGKYYWKKTNSSMIKNETFLQWIIVIVKKIQRLKVCLFNADDGGGGSCGIVIQNVFYRTLSFHHNDICLLNFCWFQTKKKFLSLSLYISLLSTS